jgi:hypothetical protein
MGNPNSMRIFYTTSLLIGYMTKTRNYLKENLTYVQPFKNFNNYTKPYIHFTKNKSTNSHNPVTVHNGYLQTDWHTLSTDMGHIWRHGDNCDFLLLRNTFSKASLRPCMNSQGSHFFRNLSFYLLVSFSGKFGHAN